MSKVQKVIQINIVLQKLQNFKKYNNKFYYWYFCDILLLINKINNYYHCHEC